MNMHVSTTTAACVLVGPVILAFCFSGFSLASDPSFPIVRNWTGTGPLRSALVVDWAEDASKPALAWGYRFSGSATSEAMLVAVAQADPRFYLRLGNSATFGVSIYGIGYDRDGDGFGISDGTQFVDGIAYTGPSDGVTATDPDDSYQEGWFDGYWAYFHRNSLTDPCASPWQMAGSGVSMHSLSHGDWDGFRFSIDSPIPPQLPPDIFCRHRAQPIRDVFAPQTTVPEPAVWTSAFVAAVFLGMFCRPRIAVVSFAAVSLVIGYCQAFASDYAVQVVSYAPGTGLDGNFIDPQSALGAPTRFTSPASPFGGPVTPFQSPFGADELVSIGFGGHLTLAFDRPVADRPPSSLYGVDLIVFGNAFFFDADFPHGIVGGLGAEPGGIEVSQDGTTWAVVNQMSDAAFPTMGFQDVFLPFPLVAGQVPSDFLVPVDPSLDPLGLDMTQLVAAYAGSGGGVGVDISTTGLPWIQFIRFTNLNDPFSGITPEIDAVSIVPEPSAMNCLLIGIVLLLIWD